MASNALNVESKLLRDAQNARAYGIAQESARLQTGLGTKLNAHRNPKNSNKPNKNRIK